MSSSTSEADRLSSLTSTQPCHHFSLAEIQSATNGFDDELVIGEGGFGKVYKGHICIKETSHIVAIKRLDSKSDQGAPEFRAEIEMLSKLRHCHLVSLIGFCDDIDNKEMILVYEYMPHGTLYHHLHKADTPLTWMPRLKIAVGPARGLDYLHTGVGTQQGVIHRDIKSSNILLDENWAAMISDFGLSKLGPTNQSISYVDTSVKGTFGYLDPEYFYTRRLTRKTDVFAFGVVLFELLSGRRPVDIRFGEEQCSLVRWAQKCVKDRKLDQLVDSNIKGTISPKCLRGFAQIAYRCLYSVVKERPSMTEVVASLQVSLELQEKHEINSAESSSGNAWFTWKIHKYFVPTTTQNSDQSGDSSSQKSLENHMNEESVTEDLKKFTYYELRSATRGFGIDSHLGTGDYAEVHKGWVDKTTYSPSKYNTGLPIAIKRLHRYRYLDFEMLKRFRHPNIVKLLGYCVEQEHPFLVYEFMPNGTLEDWLDRGAVAQLPLFTKVKMAVGIARALVFLQQTREDIGRVPPLELENIFLDEDFTVKLSNYDIFKLGLFTWKDYDDNCFFDDDYYYPGHEPIRRLSDLSGFPTVFMEVLIGRQFSITKDTWEVHRYLEARGKKSLKSIARLCFESCNEVDSESKMLTILKEYEEYIPALCKI